jgi:hypothetical protein
MADAKGSMQVEVTTEAASIFRWIADRKAAFVARELCERFPAFPFDQHRQLLEAAARAALVRLPWFPRLSAAA